MDKLQTIRWFMKDSKKHSMIYQLGNQKLSKFTSLEKNTQTSKTISSQSKSVLSILNLSPTLSTSNKHLNRQQRHTVHLQNENSFSFKLKKLPKCGFSLTMKQKRHLYGQTIVNVSQLITKTMGADIRINQPSNNRNSIKSVKRKDINGNSSQPRQTNQSTSVAVIERPIKPKRTSQKVTNRMIYKRERVLPLIRQTTPVKSNQISGWEIEEQEGFFPL